MSPPSSPESSGKGPQALLAHLRDNPADRSRHASELAAQFGLEQSFVERILSRTTLRAPTAEEAWATTTTARLVETWRKAGQWWDAGVAHPIPFVVTTVGGSLIFVGLIRYFGPIYSPDRSGYPIETTASLVFGIGVLISHMIVYYKRSMVRFVFYGALVSWVIVALAAMVEQWLVTRGLPESHRTAISFWWAGAMFLIACIYAMAGALVSLTGSYVRLRRQERRDTDMSRAEMLERLFELQSRLDKAIAGVQEETWEDRTLVKLTRRHLMPVALLLGVGVQFGFETLYTINNIDPLGAQSANGLVLIVRTALQGILVSGVAGLAFLSSSIGAAVVLAVVAQLGRFGVEALPIGQYGMGYWSQPLATTNSAGALVGYGVVAVVFGMGRAIQKRAFEELSLQRNDQAALIAEMLRIQWRLSGDSGLACVLVVDVAKSGEMKSKADPLEVEFSFHEYQEWISETCKQFGGHVVSTAGDGAVVVFKQCAEAVNAARRLQGTLDGFNRMTNRLQTPFRLRIGVHAGEIRGQAESVHFTEVIDIAAHVEEMSPVSGIGVTDSVVAHLNEEEFIPLARQVDGHAVYLALDPADNL
jgi:class 3 adenylate cyclase